MKVYEHESIGDYEWADATTNSNRNVEQGRCADCGHERPVKRFGARMLCKGCAIDAGLFQEAGA